MVMENGFSSTRNENFPAGLRVLVVDDDPTWLKILEKMLKKCSYEVTTCGLAREALRLLRDKKDGFDIVISDVNMPDMDGFRLLEHVGLEMDLPVIMMSVDGETSRVMKGVQHGACDYLLKPIRMKELKNIWQHVVRKRLHEVRDIDFFDDRDHSNDGYYGGDQTLLKKRKDVENDSESSDPSSSKKARVVWTIELHQKFVKAVNQIGIDSDKVGPKKILDLMNVPWLTRENVASHLQKYRLYLSRIRKGDENMETSFGGIKNSDFASKECGGSINVPTSSIGQQNDVTSNPMYTASRSPTQTLRSLETSTRCTSLYSPASDSCQFKSELKRQPKQTMGSIIQQQTQSDILTPGSQIDHGQSISECDGYSLIDAKPLISKQIGNNVRQTSPLENILEPFSVWNAEGLGCVFDVQLSVKNQNSDHGSSLKEQQQLVGPIFSFHSDSHLKDPPGVETKFDASLENQNQNQNQNLNATQQVSIACHSSLNDTKTESRNPVLGIESKFGILGEDLMFRWLHGGNTDSSKDFGIDDVGFSDSNFAEPTEEVPFPPYAPKFGLEYEYPFDYWVEFPVVDQGLLFS